MSQHCNMNQHNTTWCPVTDENLSERLRDVTQYIAQIAAAPTAEDLLAQVLLLVCHTHASDKSKREAVRVAYEIGLSQGRCEGAKEMGDRLCAVAAA